jgi:hypothetical protein
LILSRFFPWAAGRSGADFRKKHPDRGKNAKKTRKREIIFVLSCIIYGRPIAFFPGDDICEIALKKTHRGKYIYLWAAQ